jgi:Tfp pilus tip-associated adhesin PilY1
MFLALGFFGIVLGGIPIQKTFAAAPASLSGSTNSQFACAPPFISQAAKPNIHFVLDKTGSMTEHPYVNADNTFDIGTGYWGYFKENLYYRYDLTANNYWQENSACTNTDLIGKDDCISGKLLNYVTSSKVDIMRKILTGGRIWVNPSDATDKTVLEHELTYCSACVSADLVSEATTACNYDNSTAGKLIIKSPNSASTMNIISSSNGNKVEVTIAGSGATATATFHKTNGSNFTTAFADGTQLVAGNLFVTTGFTNAGNNGIWTIITISSTNIVVSKGTAVAAVSKANVTITTTTIPAGLSCNLFTAKSIDVPMTVDAAAKTFTRTDGGNFVTDGWAAGMEFDSDGFFDPSNNSNWTISAVIANKITVASNTGMITRAFVQNHTRFTRRLTAYSRVKSSTPADFTGLIQSMYIAPGNSDNKADIELSFFDSSNHVDYTGGDTSNSTVKNQSLSNYIGAVNGTGGDGGTNTGPALAEAEKFFQQVAVASTTKKPSSPATLLIDNGNGASDPFYNPPATGTATALNSLAAPCRKSFVILVSDGEWNDGSDPVGPAYNMHRRDLDASNVQHDLRTEAAMTGVQSVTTYTVYAFGSTAAGRNALITTAIFGGFNDINNDGLPYPFTSYPTVPPYGSSAKLKTALNTTGYTNSNSVAGTTKYFLDDSTKGRTFPMDECNPVVDANGTTHWNANCAEWDKSPGPTTDNPAQRHTGLPYNYFEATDGSQLASAMTNAVNDILARTSSSTAASILGNNDNAGASLVQAIFYPEKQFDGTIKASWIGEVQAFWYYLDPRLNNVTIREDSNNDLKLKLNEDKIAQFNFDGTYTKVNLYADANGDGTIDNFTVPPTSPDSTVDLEDVINLWRAGKTLWSRTASDRLIYTNDPTVTTVTGSRIAFKDVAPSTTLATKLQPYLDVSTATGAVPTATDVINYTRGTDISVSYSVRQRTIQLGSAQNTWKLGDVINSTPKMISEVRLNSYNLKAPSGYDDTSYDKYIKSEDYGWRGTAFVGANDGMLHAFKTGSNFIGSAQGIVAEIKNSDGTAPTDLGKELWAFVPKNVLPYLQYLMLPGYQHMYFVDSTPLLVDASIGMTNPNGKNSDGTTMSIPSSCTVSTDSSYHLCPVRTTVTASTGQLDYTTGTVGGGTSWRTVLLGSMGLGGASRYNSATCTNCVKTSIAGLGLSSFFALDVTNPISEDATDYPKLLWEFSDPRLGFSTVTPAVVRIKDSNDTASLHRNGRWAAILASGPTGPITSGALSFEGKSDMPLTIFVVDLKTGELLRTFNNRACSDAVNSSDSTCSSHHTQVTAMPDNAFAGSLSGSSIDTDKYNSTLPGAYSDDAIYIGYSRGNTATPTAWDKGGVLRLLTNNDYAHANWKVSTVIDGIGPVTSSVTKLQDKYLHQLWLYFGTGRYFVKGDDPDNVQSLFGIKDPCYNTSDTFTANCTTSLTGVTAATNATGANATGVVDQTSSIGAVASSATGWKIDLGVKSGSNYPKRTITNPVASTNGVVTFTTFTPSTDVCTYGGTTSVWTVKYNTGGVGSTNLKGQILVQLSTGAFQQIDVTTAFNQSLNRETIQYQGVPPKSEPAMTTNANHTPSKRILHIQEH